MKKGSVYILLAFFFALIGTGLTRSQSQRDGVGGRIIKADSLTLRDVVLSAVDSETADTSALLVRKPLTIDSVRSRLRREKVDLDNPVQFSAKDSMILIGKTNAYMYGNGEITYGDVNLKSGMVEMDMDKSIVHAAGVLDSLGKPQSTPVFKDKSGEYQSKEMSYNFKNQRGYLTDLITEQGEGYLTGGVTKKMENDDYFLANGRYTTCSNHEHPHFYFQLTKAKVRPKKDIVTGPAYLVLEDLPLPLAVPFGYFPFSEKYSSGVIFPSFGDDYQQGFYLKDGGYYFAINDNIDLALTGEIYTRGSWGLHARSNYVKRYRYSGNFDISFLKTILGDKGDADYSNQSNFQILWSHSQDSKANPNMSFSSSVNFTTSGYSRNDLNSRYNSGFTENTKSSTINMTYRFPQTKWSLSTTANISQRTQDSTLTVSFPNVTVSLSQVYPFKRKRAVGNEKWYEKIRLSYNGQLQNSLTAKQDEFFKKSLIKDWRNGMKHSVPISATFNLFKYFNLTPSVNLTDRMYTTKVRRQWDPAASAEVCDTTYNFYNVWDFSAAMSLDTKIYGFFTPLPFLGKKVKMIRHVLTPSISFSGAPDFSSDFFGYYGNYSYVNDKGEIVKRQYSYFPNALFGTPAAGKSGILSVNLANNLEMKVKTDNDSIGEKKISLIENFTVSQSYNFAADSLNWSNINTSLLLRLTKGFNLNLAATWDVYTYQLNEYGNPVRVNIPRWKAGKGIGRLSSTGTAFSYTFNNDTFKRKKDNKKPNVGDLPEEASGDMTDADFGSGPDHHDKDSESAAVFDADGYEKWSVPWNLTMNYSISYGYGDFDKEKLEYKGKITQNLSFTGNIRPAKGWNFGFSASYDFNAHKLAYMNCNVSRDMHCFTMRASFVPVGPYKSYNFHIAVKASILQDLKYDKRSSLNNGVKWY